MDLTPPPTAVSNTDYTVNRGKLCPCSCRQSNEGRRDREMRTMDTAVSLLLHGELMPLFTRYSNSSQATIVGCAGCEHAVRITRFFNLHGAAISAVSNGSFDAIVVCGQCTLKNRLYKHARLPTSNPPLLRGPITSTMSNTDFHRPLLIAGTSRGSGYILLSSTG